MHYRFWGLLDSCLAANEIKNNRIGKQAVKNKEDLKERLVSALDSLQQNTH